MILKLTLANHSPIPKGQGLEISLVSFLSYIYRQTSCISTRTDATPSRMRDAACFLPPLCFSSLTCPLWSSLPPSTSAIRIRDSGDGAADFLFLEMTPA